MKELNTHNFSLNRTIEILSQTPSTLEHLTSSLSEFWTMNNEGKDTWSVFDVVGHLIHVDKTDWLVRAKIILAAGGDKHFEPLDRFAQLESSKGKTLSVLLHEFKQVRTESINELISLGITDDDLNKTGIHPKFGDVTLRQLLSAWTVHDLDHISQIARVIAKQYKEETGPWIEFLKILRT